MAEMLTRGDVHDPVLEGHLITVPEVRMTADLRLATIYVMPLGGRDTEEVLEALEHNKKFLRGEIAHRVNLKFAPELRFRADERFDEVERIEKLLRTPAVQRDIKGEPDSESHGRFNPRRKFPAVQTQTAAPKNRQQFRRVKRDVHGWVVLDKPIGMTSTYAVSVVRRLFEAKSAGHAGTLDPLASGCLPIALGEATKTVPFVMDSRKTYSFTVRWGDERNTDDADGQPVATSPQRPARQAIEALLPQYTGTIEQVPPQFSAVKIAGERAYDLARDGETVELQARPVEIHSLTWLTSRCRPHRIRRPMR